MMIEKTAITIPDDVRATFIAFDDDYLADVLRVWNCDNQDWHDGITTIFRFETDDLLVWSVQGGLRATRGAVDTQSFELGPLVGASGDSCIAWRSDSSFSSLIGRAALSATLLESFV